MEHIATVNAIIPLWDIHMTSFLHVFEVSYIPHSKCFVWLPLASFSLGLGIIPSFANCKRPVRLVTTTSLIYYNATSEHLT